MRHRAVSIEFNLIENFVLFVFFVIFVAIKIKKPGSDLLSHLRKGNTISTGELDFRVRNGNGYGLSVMATEQCDYNRFLKFVNPFLL